MTLNRMGALLLWASLALSPQLAAAQGDHQYTSQDIEAGARIYSSQCALCHGANGDTVNGVNLRLGRFRRAITDEDLAGVVTNGVATGGMPSIKLSAPR
jgi:mono/diheme cytochrome c family protein